MWMFALFKGFKKDWLFRFKALSLWNSELHLNSSLSYCLLECPRAGREAATKGRERAPERGGQSIQGEEERGGPQTKGREGEGEERKEGERWKRAAGEKGEGGKRKGRETKSERRAAANKNWVSVSVQYHNSSCTSFSYFHEGHEY